MNYIINYIIWLVLGGMLWAVPVWAADITFSCDSDVSDCGLSSSDPIFDVDDMMPGQTVIKTIEVQNNSSADDCNFLLGLSGGTVTPVEFVDRLFTAVRDGADDDKFGKSSGDTANDDKNLSDLFGGSPGEEIGTIEANTSEEFDWLVTFDANAGNEFMNAEISFTAEMTGECGVVSPTTLGASTNGTGGISGLLTKFPVTGIVGGAKWLAGDEQGWSRVAALLLAVVAGVWLSVWVVRKGKAI